MHRQIALAEEELDIALFERLPNGLKLTLAGEMLYSDVLRWQKEYKQTCMRFDEIQGLKRGAIELGLIAALSDGFVVDVLATLQSEFPWITLNILTDDSDVLIMCFALILTDSLTSRKLTSVHILHFCPEPHRKRFSGFLW